MIHQLAMHDLKILVPEYKITVEATSERSFEYKRIELSVTKERLLVLDKVKIDEKFSGAIVDILGYVKGIPFGVYVTHKNRQVPSDIDPPNTIKCGVVNINIEFLPGLFRNEKEGRYIEVLRKFIEEGVEGKQWIYHPRATVVRKQAETQLQQWLSKQMPNRPKKRFEPDIDFSLPTPESKTREKIPPKPKTQYFRCVMCNATWKSVSPQCKNCDTHMYSKVINANEGET